MAFQPTLNAALLIMNWGNGEVTWSNSMWFQKVGFSVLDMRDLAEIPGAACTSAFLNHLSADFSLLSSKVYDMREEDGYVVQSTHAAKVGTGSSEQVPLQNAVVWTLRTEKRGRSGRGRMYLAGFMENDMTDQKWIPGLTNDIAAFLGTISSNALALGFRWCVHSSQHNGVVLPFGELNAISYTELRSPYAGTQRKRNLRD